MKRRFPPLHALRAFEATARLLSFQQAADELSVTHSAVSHQIKKLEEALGQPLFERLGRSIALTDAGRRYFVEIHAALNQIEHSTQMIFGEPDKGNLTVQVYMTIGSRWLIQRLGHFRQQYPDIHIELYNSFLDWDFEPHAADIGIIYSESCDQGLEYQQLFRGCLIPVCSPDLLTDGEVKSAAELLQLPFLNISESPDNLPAWLSAQGVDIDQVRVVSEHDNHLLALEAAIAGQGIAVVHSYFASGDLASNKLVIPLQRFIAEPGAWYLVQSAQHLTDRKISYFASWLHRQIAGDQWLHRVY